MIPRGVVCSSLPLSLPPSPPFPPTSLTLFCQTLSKVKDVPLFSDVNLGRSTLASYWPVMFSQQTILIQVIMNTGTDHDEWTDADRFLPHRFNVDFKLRGASSSLAKLGGFVSAFGQYPTRYFAMLL